MKKILAWIVVSVILLSAVTVGATTALMYGDANGDGRITNRDIGLLQRYINGWDVQLGPTGGSTTATTVITTSTAATRPTGADLPEGEAISVEDANALGLAQDEDTYTEESYYVSGIIAEVYNPVYGYMVIADGSGNTLTIYGAYSADGEYTFDHLLVLPKVGDTVTLYGTIGCHNGTAQMPYAWIMQHNGKVPEVYKPSYNVQTTTVSEYWETTTNYTTGYTTNYTTGYTTNYTTNYTANTTVRPTSVVEPPANSEVSIADAIAIGMSKESNVYTANKYYVTGVVVDVYNSEYGNMHIKDDKGNQLTIYGSFSADGKYSFSKLKNPPKAGDTVKIYGMIGQFGEVPQIKNGWIIEINGKTPEISAGVAEKPVATMITAPKVGVAYKFGLDQTTKGSIYYFTGAMSGYYGATQTDPALAVDVYLETADGGYKIYFKDASGVKQYIKPEQSGTHYNFTFGSTGSVFTWDSAKNSFYAQCGDAVCYMGTYGHYITIGCLTTEKIKDSDYVVHLYVVE